MSNLFHRKIGSLFVFFLKFRIYVFLFCIDAKKNLAKTKGKQLSKDMIGLPQADFIHAFHIGVSGRERKNKINYFIFALGDTFGDVTCLAGVEKTDLIKVPTEKNSSTINGN